MVTFDYGENYSIRSEISNNGPAFDSVRLRDITVDSAGCSDCR